MSNTEVNDIGEKLTSFLNVTWVIKLRNWLKWIRAIVCC